MKQIERRHQQVEQGASGKLAHLEEGLVRRQEVHLGSPLPVHLERLLQEHLVRQHQRAEHLVHHRRSGLRREGPLARQLRVPLAEEELSANPPRILRRRLVVAAMPSGAGLLDSHRPLHRPLGLRRVVHLEQRLPRLEPIQGGRSGVVRRHSDRSPPRLPSARPPQRVLVLLRRREGSGRRRMLLVLLRRQVGSGHQQRAVLEPQLPPPAACLPLRSKQ